MRKILQGIAVLISVLINTGCNSDTNIMRYHVSPSGSDDNSGLTARTAWKTLDKVNGAEFHPGDEILFESGGVWYGNLHPQGNGEPGKPITISSYGDGAKPVINIGKEEGVGIQLTNQSWWEIIGMEITSGAQPELGIRRAGIVAVVEGDSNLIEHIVIKDCYIHDIWGQMGGDKMGIALYVGPFVLGGQRSNNCTANDILIENNTIKRFNRIGIVINGKEKVIVKGNHLENLGGDAIIVVGADKGTIEHNIADQTCLRSGDPHLNTGDVSRYSWWPHTAAIWLAGCTETVMQFNEVYNTGRQPANGDGMAYDFDFGCRNCVLQYNYSRNNAGFLLIMDNTFGNITRYNISENDVQYRPTHLVSMFCDTTEQNLIHNNVFYIDRGTVDIDYYFGDEYGPKKGQGKKDKGKLGAYFRNNIFYATGDGRFRTVYSYGDSLNSAEYRRNDASFVLSPQEQGSKFLNNCYFGPWLNGLPYDPEKLLADPMFVEPGTGGMGLSILNGYKLKPESPCINAGMLIEKESVPDFYGNLVSDLKIDIGAFEYKSPDL